MSIQQHHVIHAIRQGVQVVKRSILLVVVLFQINLLGQTAAKKEKIGQVTFLTSQNIYVRFENTDGISINDTLYVRSNKKLVPTVLVKYVSSSSCSGILIGSAQLKVNDSMIALIVEKTEIKEKPTEGEIKTEEKIPAQELIPAPAKLQISKGSSFARRMSGRFSIASYTSMSNTSGLANLQNWRYTLSMDADSLFRSPVSFSSYINFVYRADQWASVTSHWGDAIKIYDLAFKYAFSKKTSLVLGRKINPKTSSLGAIDGLQFETAIKKFTLGAIVGSRPDFSNYGLNAKLFEYGGYISRDDSISTSTSMQNTVGVFQQTNDFKTDRRFLYFQHTSNFSQSFGLFFSSEFELYKRKKGVGQNVFDISSIFCMASYTPSNWLSLSATYDARKNVVYYETFKNIADSIFDSATRQGLGFRLNIRPVNSLWLSTNFNYRFSAADPQPARNYGGSLSYIQLPIIYSSLYINYNRIENGYVKGNYYGGSINKDLFNGYFNIGLGYRKVDYTFPQSSTKLMQDIASIDLSWRVLASTFFTLSYEGTFQDKQSYSHVYIGLNTRF